MANKDNSDFFAKSHNSLGKVLKSKQILNRKSIFNSRINDDTFDPCETLNQTFQTKSILDMNATARELNNSFVDLSSQNKQVVQAKDLKYKFRKNNQD